jgi:hypothetical protein
MDALDRYIGQRPSGYLYHYTGVSGLLGIVCKRKLWATDYQHLNDRKEYRIGERLLRDELAKRRLKQRERMHFESLVAKNQRGCFVLSFSESGDQLSQWRAYCPAEMVML